MCMFKTPKPAATPAPPPPPPEEAPTAPVFDDAKLSGESRDDARRVRRVGRSALRIDLQAPSASGDGIQTSSS